MLDLGEYLLGQQLNKNLDALEDRAKNENKKITRIKRADGICVVDAFDVPIAEEVSSVLRAYIPFLKSFTGKEPRTVADFVRYAGGLSKAHAHLIFFRTRDVNNFFEPRLQDQDISVIACVDFIEFAIARAINLVSKYSKRSEKNARKTIKSIKSFQSYPYCALCFRRVFRSRAYCRNHHPSLNKDNYKKSQRKLRSAIYRYCDDEKQRKLLQNFKSGKEGLSAAIYFRWLNIFSEQIMFGELNQFEVEKKQWQEYAKYIRRQSQISYPNAYEKFGDLENDQECFDDWIIEVIRTLGGDFEANMWKTKDVDIWLTKSSDLHKTMTLIHCIRRFEAMTVVASFPVKSGPKKSVHVDEEQKKRLIKLLKYESDGSKRSIKEVAEILGISRQAVYKKIKKFGINR